MIALAGAVLLASSPASAQLLEALFGRKNPPQGQEASPPETTGHEALPPEMPPVVIQIPLPPSRPARLGADIPANSESVAAVSEKKPAADPALSREDATVTPIGRVYRSLEGNQFVPFREVKPVQLTPKLPAASPPPPVQAQPPQQVQQETPLPPAEDNSKPDVDAAPTPPESETAPVASVPLPPPAPTNRQQLAAALQPPMMSQADDPQQFASVPPPPSASGSVPTMSEQQILERANRYFNTLNTMQASFTQVGGEGQRMTGTLYLERPGRMRFAYDPPATMEIISDGRSVAVRDSKLKTSDVYSINQTPLKFLLRDPINLGTDLKVIDVRVVSNNSILITLEDGSTLGGKAQITLFFDMQMQNLNRWRILDAQGFVTTVTLSNIQRTRRDR